MPRSKRYRDLPSVESLLDRLESRLPRRLLVDLARSAIEAARTEIGRGNEADPAAEADRMVRAVERSAGVEVINATGVILHTNLGRARWGEDAAARALAAATGYTNVELDVETGKRSRRGAYVTRLLRALTGSEDALVVNNNASALLLALAATSSGRGVPVARGELIEIGGSYRLPAVIEASGARLIEVGTTNRTRVGDFETALQLHDCGAILKVHPSNYRIEGFTEETELYRLAELAENHGLMMIYDIGSGLLDADTPWLSGPPPDWLRGEPAARQSLEEGADIVTFSGDKLLGGPQAGIVVGSAEAVGGMRQHPLARALRVDGVTLGALGATLEAYADDDPERLPFWRQALSDPAGIDARARHMADALDAETAPGESAVGAGSVPGMTIPTTLVVLEGEDHLYLSLLASDPPVMARREEGSLIIDLRTVDPSRDDLVTETVKRCR